MIHRERTQKIIDELSDTLTKIESLLGINRDYRRKERTLESLSLYEMITGNWIEDFSLFYLFLNDPSHENPSFFDLIHFDWTPYPYLYSDFNSEEELGKYLDEERDRIRHFFSDLDLLPILEFLDSNLFD